jgi:hypothetical protein
MRGTDRRSISQEVIHRRIHVVPALGREERMEERRRLLAGVCDIDDLRDERSVRKCPDVIRHERSEGEEGDAVLLEERRQPWDVRFSSVRLPWGGS